jgi:hypothetical protein
MALELTCFSSKFSPQRHRGHREKKNQLEEKDSDLDDAIIKELIELALLVTNGRTSRVPGSSPVMKANRL